MLQATKRFLLSVSFLLLLGSLCMAEQKTENVGSTSITGYLNTKAEGDFVNITAELIVVKSGMFGTGKGHLEVTLLDEKFEAKNPITIDLTVGAKVPEGTHQEGESRTLKIPKGKFFGLVWSISGANDEGVPLSLSELIEDAGKKLKEIGGILEKLKPGESKSVGKASVMRF